LDLLDDNGGGQTPLMHASALSQTSTRDLLGGDIISPLSSPGDIVKVLLQESNFTLEQINQADSHKNTALHFAAENNNAKVIKQLLAAKADPTVHNDDGKSPQDLATSEYVREMLADAETSAFSQTLVLSPRSQAIRKSFTDSPAAAAASASSGSENFTAHEQLVLNTVGNEEDTYMHLVSMCIDGCKPSLLERVLRESKVDINKTDTKGTSLLMHATWHEHEEVIQVLLKTKADPCLKNSRLNSALHYAYEKENEHIIHLLIQHGGSLVLRDPNELGLIPAEMANNEYLRCEDLTEVAPEAPETPETAAAKLNQSSHFAMLAQVPLTLSTACKQGDMETVKALLERKVNPNETNTKQSTPLMHAVWYQNMEMVEALLDANSDPNMQNASGNTPLHFAYELNNEEIVNTLLAYGGMMALGLENSKGKTPMDMSDDEYLRCDSAMDTPDDDAMLAYTAKFVAPKEDDTHTSTAKVTGVIKAAKDDLSDKLHLLLEKQADPNERDKSGTTPLMHAIRLKHLEIAKMLLNGKADPNVANKRKNTALHFAFQADNRIMVKLLVQYGAEKSAKKKNSSGKTPQQLTTKAYLRGLDLGKLHQQSIESGPKSLKQKKSKKKKGKLNRSR